MIIKNVREIDKSLFKQLVCKMGLSSAGGSGNKNAPYFRTKFTWNFSETNHLSQMNFERNLYTPLVNV